MKDKLKRFGLFEQFGEGRFFPTIDAAVSRYRELHGIDGDLSRGAVAG